jgi:hypothetical protein
MEEEGAKSHINENSAETLRAVSHGMKNFMSSKKITANLDYYMQKAFIQN